MCCMASMKVSSWSITCLWGALVWGFSARALSNPSVWPWLYLCWYWKLFQPSSLSIQLRACCSWSSRQLICPSTFGGWCHGGVGDCGGEPWHGGCDCCGERQWQGDWDRQHSEHLLGPGWGKVFHCLFVLCDDALKELSSHEGGSKCFSACCWGMDDPS